MNQELKTTKKQIVFGEDSVIIQKWEGDIKGGRALDWTDVKDEVLYAGRVIVTDGKGTYKPLPIETGNYKDLGTASDPIGALQVCGCSLSFHSER